MHWWRSSDEAWLWKKSWQNAGLAGGSLVDDSSVLQAEFDIFWRIDSGAVRGNSPQKSHGKGKIRMRMMMMVMMMMGCLMEQWWCGCWFQRCFFSTMGMGWWSQLSFRRCFRMAQPPAGEVVSLVLEIMGIQWDTNGKWMTCSWDLNRTLVAYKTKRPKPSTRIGGNSQNSRTLQIVELLKLIQMTFNCLQRKRRCSGNWWLLVGIFSSTTD